MKLIKSFFIAAVLISSVSVFAKGGDDAGNGGFAYAQSIKILKMATAALEEKIQDSQLQDLVDHPERRTILQDTLAYEKIRKLYLWNLYRDRKKLEMDYDVNPPRVTVTKAYYVAFESKTGTELEDASLEVQKRLVHEAAHIWGYKEDAAEIFAIAFMNHDDGNESGHGDRPTNSVDIKSDFCSCLNGKSDIINNCDNFCATKPVSDQPVLYVNTILGPDITLNSKLGNLYNWCTVQLKGDSTTPQCTLVARDGTVAMSLPVTVTPGSNSFSANISSLSKDHTWILRLEESKTGSSASSKEFQLRRKSPPSPDPDQIGALKIIPVSQYTCLLYGGKVDPVGNIQRTTYVRNFYYFAANENLAPIPAAGGTNQSLIVCHDEQLNPGNDSAEYNRLELYPNLAAMWDRHDSRFVSQIQNGGKLKINKILEERLLNEYGISGVSLNLFTLISFPNRPTNINSSLGYIMVPFVNEYTGKTYCPTSTDYNGNQPLLNLLGEYMDDTEGLYVAEKEAETVNDGSTYKTIYGTMFTRQSILMNYGFYIENGLKIRADANSLHTKTIYYYWPASPTADPLTQGNRKLFTVRTPDTLNGNIPSGLPETSTTDKRIGCVPRN
ncbi:MAG: hypothetical protein H7177_15280 [Rhizobacter sp.]|nr:hypothetical protein [Bacteriovorax sp.]